MSHHGGKALRRPAKLLRSGVKVLNGLEGVNRYMRAVAKRNKELEPTVRRKILGKPKEVQEQGCIDFRNLQK